MKFLLRFHIRTDKWLPKVNCHTYLIHGTNDWLIPISNSEKLLALNPRKVTLIRIKGGGHNDLPSFPEYHNFLRDILKS
jgi:pimeloyl-ACP methyl ester carboxylesterase